MLKSYYNILVKQMSYP